MRRLGENTFEIQKLTSTFKYKGYVYRSERVRGKKTYYRCSSSIKLHCKARLSAFKINDELRYKEFNEHNHAKLVHNKKGKSK